MQNFGRRVSDHVVNEGTEEAIIAQFEWDIHAFEVVLNWEMDELQRLTLEKNLAEIKWRMVQYKMEMLQKKHIQGRTTIVPEQIPIEKDRWAKSFITQFQGVLLGVLLWAWVATISGQMASESPVQERASFLVENILGIQDTWYNRIQEGKKTILVIKKQAQSLAQAQREKEIRQEIAVLEAQIAETTRRIALLDEEQEKEGEILWKVNISPNSWNKIKTIQEKTLNPNVYKSTSYMDVKKVRDEVVREFPANLQVKLREDKNGWVLIYVVYNGKKSTGFYSNTSKFQERITVKWMRNWAANFIDQTTQDEKRAMRLAEIKKIAAGHGISTEVDSPISMKIKTIHNGDIIISFHDSFNNSVKSLTVRQNEKSGDIAARIDKILTDFVI